jgi:VWFA-related protein
MGRTNLRSAFVIVFLVALFSSAQLGAQAAKAEQNMPTAKPVENATPADIPTFTSSTQLVLVPVMVKGKSGEHIGGLGRDAFKVEEQGKLRTVATFEEVKPVAPGVKATSVQRLEGRSNFNFEDAPRGHMTIVVMDLLNTPYLYLGDGKRQMIELLAKALPANEATVVFALGIHGLRQLYAPTADTAGLLASMRGVKGANEMAMNGQPASAAEALSNAEFNIFHQLEEGGGLRGGLHASGDLQDTSWTTLTALSQIASAYDTIPGRKTLIWASAGMIGQPSMGMSRWTLRDKIEDTWRELNAADIAVYSVDVSGLAGFNGTLTRYGALAERERSLRSFAEETGGKWCAGTTVDIEKCLVRSFDDAGSYYLLGYYLPDNEQKPGWRKLKVKVASDGAHVRAREGFYASGAKAETPAERQRRLVAALQSPVELTGVRLNVREVSASPETKAAAAGTSRHEFAIGVLGDSIRVDERNGNAVDLSVVAVAFARDGKERGHIDHQMTSKVPPELLQKFRKTGLSTRQSLELAKGNYDIKFAVRDNLTGEIGTVEYPLEVK